MKKILLTLIILSTTYCNSTPKKESGYTFDNFLITKSRIGIFLNGMTMNDVYKFIPKEQIKKTIGTGEFVEDTYTDYEIYDSNGKKILVLTPYENDNLNSKINRILILDPRFKTAENIGLNSTFDALKKHYPNPEISLDMKHIVLDVEALNAWFSIKKTELEEAWWNGSEIDTSKIPEEAKLEGITIWWE